MRKVVVVGAGMTVFGKFPEKTIEELGSSAVRDALADAGMKPKDIEVAYCGNLTESRFTGHLSCLGQTILRLNGINKIPIMRVEDACASGLCALREAWVMVGSGMYDIALALGAEKLTGQGAAVLARLGTNIDGMAGLAPPGMWAMRAQRHMHEYGTTIEQLAKIAVKNHHNGCLNPRSQYQKELTVEQVVNYARLCRPLGVLDACPTTDGAAAVILCSENVARRYTTKIVYLDTVALSTGNYNQPRDLTIHDLEKRCAKEAFERSGIGPENLDFAEVHDCFTIAEAIRCESLGFCGHGEYVHLLEEGKWDLGGEFPINPSGGLLSKGHPIGATGVAQACELTWQLRGEAQKPERQIKGAKAALGHCSGGILGDDTPACAVEILHR